MDVFHFRIAQSHLNTAAQNFGVFTMNAIITFSSRELFFSAFAAAAWAVNKSSRANIVQVWEETNKFSRNMLLHSFAVHSRQCSGGER